MASKILQVTRGLQKRWFSVSPLSVPLSEAIPYTPEFKSATADHVSDTETVRVTKLSNGVTVASRSTPSLLSNISIFIKSGSRSEQYNQKGITHLLGNSAYLSTTDKSGFLVKRELEHLGVTLSSTNTREFVVFNSILPNGREDVVMDAFGSVVSTPALYHWEVKDEWPRLTITRNEALSNPSNVVTEELHKYAFRNGLCNSIYCPSINNNKFESTDLREFIDKWYIGQNTIVVGVGVNHDNLVRLATKSFSSLPDRPPTTLPHAEYNGGGEVHIEANTNLVEAAIVCKGASLTGDPKDLMSSHVLQHMLGEERYIKWGSGSAASNLNKAVGTKVNTPFQIKALNINYSDNGLFGMRVYAQGESFRQVIKSAVQELADIAKGKFTEGDLNRAKNQLKNVISTNNKCQSTDVINIANQVAFTGGYQEIYEQSIDSITAQDVTKFAKTLFAVRPNFVAHGNLCNCPRLDEIVGGFSVK